MLVDMESDATHEHETEDPNETWQTLLAATGRALSAKTEQNYERREHCEPTDNDEQRDEDQRQYVTYRLQEAAAFERQARGLAPRPLKRMVR